MISTKLLALSAIAVVGMLSTSAEAHAPVTVSISPVGLYVGPPPPPPPVVYDEPAPVYVPAPVVYQRPVVVYDRYDRCDHRGHRPGRHHGQWQRGHSHRGHHVQYQPQRGVRHRR
jgi:hypothetical protein